MATRRVLLDANLLIAALDHEGTSIEDAKVKARHILSELMSDSNVAVAITPLIRYEVLRGIDLKNAVGYRHVKEALDNFMEFDITRAMSERAAELFRRHQAEQRGSDTISVDKRRFDAFHVATASLLGMELRSEDNGIRRLWELDALIASEPAY